MSAYVDKFNATFQTITDIHLETTDICPDFAAKWPALTPCLILSGDIGHVSCPHWWQFMNYVSSNWDIVIYVLGNHEFYSCNQSYDKLLIAYETSLSDLPNIHLLYNRSMGIECNGQIWAVIGSTAWGSAEFSLVLSINDFRKIKSYNNPRAHLKPISIKEYQEMHNRDMEYIISELDGVDPEIPVVVVTHFPLTRDGTSDPIYGNQSRAIKAYYANELHDKLKGNLRLTLVAGHTHHKYDFIMDDVRYISSYTN
jgi:hypothetical protein